MASGIRFATQSDQSSALDIEPFGIEQCEHHAREEFVNEPHTMVADGLDHALGISRIGQGHPVARGGSSMERETRQHLQRARPRP